MDKYKFWQVTLITIFLLLFVPLWWVERELRIRVAEVYLAVPFRQADIKVNVNRSFGTMPRVWRAFAQGGEEGAGIRMLQPTVALMKKIGPDYIRLDHIFDDDYYGVMKAKGDYDWSKLDATVEDIVAMGAKPFFSLSYMPSAVASSKIEVPANWADWQDLTRAIVEHYSGKIDGVYYEVWNEPSLDQFGGWKMYGNKDYRLLYKHAVLGAMQARGARNFKIGGPAIPILDSTWVKLLFDFCLSNNLRLDFISWHRYGFSPDIFLNDVYQINILTGQARYQKFAGAELVITEWGPNSEKDTVYSSNVAASHAVAVIRKLLDKTALIFAFEVKDGPGQGSEAWGLLTHEGTGEVKEKPRFYLYDWLGELEGERLEVLGEGTQITGFAGSDNRTVTLVLANYQPGGGHEESFNITFNGLKDGQYRLFEQKLFGQPQEKEVMVQGGSVVLNENLKSYEVMRIRLIKVS
ncbi:MAG TPA: hypothetical protein VMW29_00320 [Candidatus Bathyarchaeia archaeon]|nr:hypothetical protein [Candidatus Bathyarchaeia archaeon]